MPRTNWKESSPQLQAQLRLARRNIPDFESALSWINRVFNAGYDVDESEVPFDHVRALEALPPAQRGMYGLQHSIELQQERSAMSRFQAMRTWAANTSIESDQAAKDAARNETERQRQAFIAKRSKELEAQKRAEQTADIQRRASLEFDARNPRGAA